MPQPVTVSIALDNPSTEADCNENDCSSKKNIEPPSPPQGQERRVAATASALSHATMKRPHHSGGGLQTNSFASVNCTGSMTRSEFVPPNCHPAVAKAPSPIKRTKKNAKPRVKAKANVSSCARKSPTKKNRRPNIESRPAEAKPVPCGKPLKIVNVGGDAAITVPHSHILSLEKDVHPQTNNSKAVSKRPNVLPPSGEPTKKRTKKLKMAEDQGIHNLSITTKNPKEPSPTKQGKVKGDKTSSQAPLARNKKNKVTFPSTITGDAQLKKVVSAVVDMVAHEIRYCASMFGSRNLRNKKLLCTSKTPRISRKSPFGGHRDESFKGSRICAGKDAQSKDYSVNISAEGNLHPVENGVPFLEQSDSGISANSEPEMLLNGEPSNTELYDFRTVVIAVRRFVLEVYCSFLLSAKKSIRNNSADADRIRVSTLLAIREMLIMNADKLFSFPSLKLPPANRIASGRIYLSHVFADAIVRNTAKRFQLCRPGSRFLADFTQAAQNYDTNSEDFRFSLVHADAQSAYAHFMGGNLHQEESVLAKVSFNYARSRHPLLHNKANRLIMKDGAQVGMVESESSLTHPIPTACTVFHIEAAAVSDEATHEDVTKILESLRKVLRSERATK